MEDMARLAVFEQSLNNNESFIQILYELLEHICKILESPHDYEIRTIENNILKKVLNYEPFTDYLKYIGFKLVGNRYTYPKEQILGNLRIAQAAIERKIIFCNGSLEQYFSKLKSSRSQPCHNKSTLTPANILNTNNPILLKIETLFNNMIKYEDEELQEEAREHIPLVTLQLKALDRIREQQKKIKSGEIKTPDLSFDIALLLELLGWFKYKFFSWVDKPQCEACGGATEFVKSQTKITETETCKLEVYKCKECAHGTAEFPRFNDVRRLLVTRRGRCGEWANCFTLLCRALGYDTRYVYDTTDHVWCEVFDYDSNMWLHVDPCEGKLNAPLMYSHGWGKKLMYVIALSRDDLQDVTWRYTSDHKSVLKRRHLCDEKELIISILKLREHRQKQVSEARRQYLNKRCVQELVQLMMERKPSDYESHGRISGSKEWRRERGEIGNHTGHQFTFEDPGEYSIQYYTASDKYKINCNGKEKQIINSWAAGVYNCSHIFRKHETDWHMVYLAREEGEPTGSISWKLLANKEDLNFVLICIKLNYELYENGNVVCQIKFDDEEPFNVKLGGVQTEFKRKFKEMTLTAHLSGGVGDVAWQHAQLFRQSTNTVTAGLDILAKVETIS